MYEKGKSCEYNANAKAAGRVAGVDPIEQITRRCIRIVETLSGTEIGGCVLYVQIQSVLNSPLLLPSQPATTTTIGVGKIGD
ncbi:hypothetical protein FRX31_009421 [Thalictrum thalictroides]|uniref:Uncharacterized protein n=1 Tax=Thalictrum thalictroides TaxID=46969 RepID=A0A7J6WXZ9_THATH|nr:hypothetical protein FRX31_009421 [Thalictrum thalictroides]